MSETPDFETSLKRLEEIVKKLENGELSLDSALQLFEEGIKLSRFCHTKLEEAERGEAYLTLRQAEAVARLYERPLAALFLPEPPREEPPEAQFRRLPGAPEPPWPQAFGVLRAVERPSVDMLAREQEKLAESMKGPKDLSALLQSGDTWDVGAGEA